MADTLEQVLIDLRDEARVLDKHGDPRAAKIIDDTLDRVRSAAEDYLTWLLEDDAMLQSDHAQKWFRARYPEWLAQGNAKMVNGRRYYRALLVPRRANRNAAFAAGQAAARMAG